MKFYLKVNLLYTELFTEVTCNGKVQKDQRHT